MKKSRPLNDVRENNFPDKTALLTRAKASPPTTPTTRKEIVKGNRTLAMDAVKLDYINDKRMEK